MSFIFLLSVRDRKHALKLSKFAGISNEEIYLKFGLDLGMEHGITGLEESVIKSKRFLTFLQSVDAFYSACYMTFK